MHIYHQYNTTVCLPIIDEQRSAFRFSFCVTSGHVSKSRDNIHISSFIFEIDNDIEYQKPLIEKNVRQQQE